VVLILKQRCLKDETLNHTHPQPSTLTLVLWLVEALLAGAAAPAGGAGGVQVRDAQVGAVVPRGEAPGGVRGQVGGGGRGARPAGNGMVSQGDWAVYQKG